MRFAKYQKISLILFFLTFSLNSYAGIADLSLSIEFDDIDNGVNLGQIGTFRLTVTNNGPDPAGIDSNEFPISVFSPLIGIAADGTDASFTLDESVAQLCSQGLIIVEPRPPNQPGYVYVFRTPSIASGQEVTCHGIYRIGFESGSRTYEWSVNGYIDDTDPNTQNNIDTVFFGIEVLPVPTLSLLGIITVILLVLFSILIKKP